MSPRRRWKTKGGVGKVCRVVEIFELVGITEGTPYTKVEVESS